MHFLCKLDRKPIEYDLWSHIVHKYFILDSSMIVVQKYAVSYFKIMASVGVFLSPWTCYVDKISLAIPENDWWSEKWWEWNSSDYKLSVIIRFFSLKPTSISSTATVIYVVNSQMIQFTQRKIYVACCTVAVAFEKALKSAGLLANIQQIKQVRDVHVIARPQEVPQSC